MRGPFEAAAEDWELSSSFKTVFSLSEDEGREDLLALYERGKSKQWNASTRIDWSLEVPEENPTGLPDRFHPLYGTRLWPTSDPRRRRELLRHNAAWQLSQSLHGEQGALLCTGKLVQTVPDLDAKYFAATQAIDEARHAELFSRFLREKVGFRYPINDELKTLIQQTVEDPRWDFTYLGMQVLVEGLALASFSGIRNWSTDPLTQSIYTYVIEDEARHVAFGRYVLKDLYAELGSAELAEREEFVIEGSRLLRDRLLGKEQYEALGFAYADVRGYLEASDMWVQFRRMLFARIIPTLRHVGLFGPRVQRAFEKMGVLRGRGD